ncbi:hypothetical protein [Paenibacillus sp. GP183]|jgi:hypothetical protein|uniref:hypothetical protein n=1 Tax=Paenibacillus sp. GP183 TaxID=1882751 RepID=UPI000B85F45B|nr:hypothetical protein [Paenibacillus sp. GP183]
MTIYKADNYEYIYNGFKTIDKDVFHFCLLASEETLQERLAARGDTPGGWTYQQIKKCENALKDKKFEEQIITDTLDTNDVIIKILSKITQNPSYQADNPHHPIGLD